MANLTQTIPDYIGGVSKRPDDKKLLGQVIDCQNGYPDTTFGLTKRPGFKYIKSFGSSESEFQNAKWFHIHRDADENYIGCIKGSAIKVWNASTGVEATITVTSPAASYLTGTKSTDYDVLTIQDTTIITNKTKVTAMSTAPTFVANKQGTVRVMLVDDAVTYVVTIKPAGQSAVTLTVTPTSGDKIGDILGDLKTAIEGGSYGGGFSPTVTQIDTSLEIVGSTAFTLTATSGKDGTNLKAYQDQVDNITWLPAESKNGRVVKIIQTADVVADDYYVKFVADDGTSGLGFWEETISPSVSASLDSATMPHELINTATNAFTYRPVTWTNRLVGDDVTNPQTSFVGQKLEQCFFYNNRLGFLSRDNIIFSQAGEFYNFFKASARVQIASDPVDVNVSSIEPVVLRGVVPATQGLVLFSKDQQFLLTAAEGILTPTSIVIRNVSNYEMDTDIDPVDNGSNLIFVSKTPGFTRVYRMMTKGQENNPQVEDIGRTISEWIPETIEHIVTSPQNAFIGLYGTTKKDVYFFSTHIEGDQFAMQAWFNWKLPGETQFIVVDSDVMYAVTTQGGEYTISSASINQTPEETILVSSEGQKMNPCLDLYEKLTAADVKHKALDVLTITTAGTGYVGTPTIAITPFQSGQGSGATATLTMSSGGVSTVTLTAVGSGYLEGATVTIGTAWAPSTAYVVGNQRSNGGKLYTCSSAGTSASSGGPTGTGTDIVDGGTTWNHAGTAAVVEATVYDGSKCYPTFKNDTDLTPILVVGSDSAEIDGTKEFVESGFTTNPTAVKYTDANKDPDFYFGLVGKDLSSVAAKVVVGWAYSLDIELPSTYFRTDGRTADTSATVIINRYKFSMGLSGVCQFKLKPRGGDEWSNTAAVIDAQQYLANDVPLSNQSVVTVPIHQRNNNFTLRVYSDSPFPVSLTSMMWEGNYSPRFYRRA